MAGNQPKVSIIMPVYNAERYLKECLESVLNQTLKDIEIICVDDGSTDGSLSILQEFEHRDSRVKCVIQPNLGAGVARNHGMKYAQGEYLTFLDCDDIFEYNMLEIMFNCAHDGNLDVVICRSDGLDDKTYQFESRPWTIKKELLPSKTIFSADDVPKDFFRLFIWWPWDKLYKKSFVEDLGVQFQDLRTTNDLYFVSVCVLSAARISYVNDVLAHHRINEHGSLSVTREKSWDCFYKALVAVRDFLITKGLYERFRLDFINYSLNFSLWQINSIHGPSYYKLRAKLCDEWFTDLGINLLQPDKFYSHAEYLSKCKLEVANRVFNSVQADFQPKVSVILPCLNSMAYLYECLESVINQTMPEIEILCVDAGSTDGTLETLEAYAALDKRIRIIHSDRKSYGHQVNLGINAARGNYMAIVESDDYIKPDMYEVLYRIAQKYKPEVIKSDFCRFYGEGKSRTFELAKIYSKDEKAYGCMLNPQTNLDLFNVYVLITPALYSLTFIREKGIRLNETAGASYQDNGFWFQILMKAERLWLCPQAFYMLRRDNPNSSVKSKAKVYAMCVEYDFIYSLLDSEDKLAKYAAICAHLRFNNYDFTMTRISEEFKFDFVMRFSTDFKQIRDRGELKEELFSPGQWKRLLLIMDDPVKYYCVNVRRIADKPKTTAQSPTKTKFKAKAKEIKSKDYEILVWKYNRLRFDFNAMQNSVSFRVGRKITWAPRKVRGAYRCLKQHGLGYTVKRTIEHLGIDMGTGDFGKR